MDKLTLHLKEKKCYDQAKGATIDGTLISTGQHCFTINCKCLLYKSQEEDYLRITEKTIKFKLYMPKSFNNSQTRW